MCGILRGLRREPPPPPQPRVGASAGGQDPGEALPQDDNITAPFAAEFQFFLRSFLDARILVEFASVVDALRCTVEVERGMAERNIISMTEPAPQVDRAIRFMAEICSGPTAIPARICPVSGVRRGRRDLRRGPDRSSCCNGGQLDMGSSLKGAIVSRLMYLPRSTVHSPFCSSNAKPTCWWEANMPDW
jgi:hypothetical protein